MSSKGPQVPSQTGSIWARKSYFAWIERSPKSAYSCGVWYFIAKEGFREYYVSFSLIMSGQRLVLRDFLWPLVSLIWSRHERSSGPACQRKSAPSLPPPPIRLQENARLSFQPECMGCARCSHQCQRSTVPEAAPVKALTGRRDGRWEVESNGGLASQSANGKSRWRIRPPQLSAEIVLSMLLSLSWISLSNADKGAGGHPVILWQEHHNNS